MSGVEPRRSQVGSAVSRGRSSHRYARGFVDWRIARVVAGFDGARRAPTRRPIPMRHVMLTFVHPDDAAATTACRPRSSGPTSSATSPGFAGMASTSSAARSWTSRRGSRPCGRDGRAMASWSPTAVHLQPVFVRESASAGTTTAWSLAWNSSSSSSCSGWGSCWNERRAPTCAPGSSTTAVATRISIPLDDPSHGSTARRTVAPTRIDPP